MRKSYRMAHPPQHESGRQLAIEGIIFVLIILVTVEWGPDIARFLHSL